MAMRVRPSRESRSAGSNLSVRPLGRDDFPIIEKLFGPKGACAGCWCMYWRLRGNAWKSAAGETNKAAFRELVETGRVQGVLAFADAEPVGWCNIGPREDFSRLQASRVLATGAPDGTWGVLCFFVPPQWRNRGVASALLAGAVALARKSNAKLLEGYPVNSGTKGTIPAAFAWTGVPRLFENTRFRNATPKGQSRPIYRLDLGRRRG